MKTESILFLIASLLTGGLAYYTVRQYLKVQQYEQQVNRGWEDLINRAEKMIAELKELNIKSKTIKKK